MGEFHLSKVNLTQGKKFPWVYLMGEIHFCRLNLTQEKKKYWGKFNGKNSIF